MFRASRIIGKLSAHECAFAYPIVVVLALISGGATSVLELSTEGVIDGFPCLELGGNVGIENDNIGAFGEASRVLTFHAIAEVVFLAQV
jgi:hypothetical protein